MERTKKANFKIVRTSDIESEIIIGLIESDEFIKQIRDVWDNKLILSSGVKEVAKWLFEYYDTTKKAIGAEWEDLYIQKIRDKKETTDEEDELLKDLKGITEGLKGKYKENGFNLQNLIQDTNKLFQKRRLELHNEQIQTLTEAGEYNEAEKLVNEFKPFETGNTNKIVNYFYTLNQLKLLDKEKPKVLMKPWLCAGQITFLYGEAGCGKSLLAMNIAYLLGMEISDSSQYEIGEWIAHTPTGCLYVDGEMGAVDFEERLRGFEYLGKQKEGIETIGFIIPEYQLKTEDTFYLSERKNQLQVIQWLKEHPLYKLLILDSVTTLFGLEDENTSSEWNLKITPFIRDIKAMGVACIILHHSGKDQNKGLRGSSAMSAMAHYIFLLTNHPEKQTIEDEGEAWFTLTKKKQRGGGYKFKKFALHYSQNSAFTETEWETTKGGNKIKSKLNDKDIRIIGYVLRGKLSGKQIAERIPCAESNVTRIINKAKKFNYLTPDGKPTLLWEELIKEIDGDNE